MHHGTLTTRSRRGIHLISAALVGVAALAAGCAGTKRVEYKPETGAAWAIRPSNDVEVVVDGLPERRFTDTGTFKAHTGSSERSIVLIKERAAAAGLDGVYSFDCDTRFNGECVAKGFMYVEAPRQDAPNNTVALDK